ncbi:response regulator [Methanoplanus endosymbiosus]|uniref:histidine kinase n=1 Tax=Methanoplanus endosymbiosus TaxID=33865 RepID=A0A9E7PT98_9EURY|nr:response regulator [Methanoplanus endosymbiosus]UUX93472.1 PAS domain S-box protein [Methanoplanus endosymbiosus]
MEENINQINLLYVDGEETSSELSELYSESDLGFKVDTVSSAEEGLDKLHNRRYDIIVSDYFLYGMDGIEFLKNIRGSGNNIPFIIFTGKGSEEVAMEALNAGADYYLRKSGVPKVRFGELRNYIIKLVEKRRAEENLDKNKILESRKNIEALFNNIDLLLFVLDERGFILNVNDAVINCLGYNKEEIFGQSVLMLHPEEERDKADCIMNDILAGKYDSHQVPLVTKNGHKILVETKVSWGEWDGQPAIFGISKDISQLRLSEDKFSAVFNSSASIMAVSTKEDGRYIDVNDSFVRKIGYPRNEVLGKTANDLNLFVYPEDRLNAFQILEEEGRVTDIEIPVRKKNGEIMYGFFSVDYIIFGKIPCLLTTMVDITARKNAEEELQKIRNRFELAVDASEHGLWDWNLDTDEIYFSPRYYTMLGYEPEELPMSLSTWVDLMHPEDRGEVVPRIYGYVQEARPYREDFRLRKKDGSWMWISGRGKSYEVDDEGIPHRAVGTHVDVTYRKQTEEALKALNKKLNLLSSVTRHDIINQLSGIRAYQELLKGEIDEEKVREYLEPMIKATAVIEKKIRFTSDYQDLGVHVPAWQNIESVVQSVMQQICSTLIKVKSDTGTLEIYADPMLEKVFYNLFENAFWHGENVTEIKVSFHEKDGFGVVVVEDNGKGVAVNMKNRIFEHGVGSNTGLGLFLVKEILDITGISISETGTEGSGARFEITVPKGGYRME